MAEPSTWALTRLTDGALSAFTASHTRAPSQSIAAFLTDQRAQAYPIQKLPDRASVPPTPTAPASPPARRRVAVVAELESTWAEARDAVRGGGSALRLVTEDEREAEQARLKRAHDRKEKKPSLVSQLKPRTKPKAKVQSSVVAVFADSAAAAKLEPKKAGATPSSRTALLVSNRKVMVAKGKEKEVVRLSSDDRSTFGRVVKGTSGPPPLKSKTNTKKDNRSNKENIPPSATDAVAVPKKRGRPAGSKNETGVEADAVLRKRTRSGAVDGRRSGTSEGDHAESDEVATRLAARRERRRDKAGIRKDPRQSLTAAAAAEGTRVRRATRHSRKSHRRDSSDAASTSSTEPRRAKKRKRSTRELAPAMPDRRMSRPSNITPDRLSLPVPRHGMFAGGAVSKKVERKRVAAPELVFSDLKFLNQYKDSTSASQTQASVPTNNDKRAPRWRPPSRHNDPQLERNAPPNRPSSTKKRTVNAIDARAAMQEETVRVAVEAAVAAAVAAIRPQQQQPPPRPPHALAPPPPPQAVPPAANPNIHLETTANRSSGVSLGHPAYSLRHRPVHHALLDHLAGPANSASAALAGSSLAELSAQRDLSAVRTQAPVEMDTTGAAWNAPPARAARASDTVVPLERTSCDPVASGPSRVSNLTQQQLWVQPTTSDSAAFDDSGTPVRFGDNDPVWSADATGWRGDVQFEAVPPAAQAHPQTEQSFVYSIDGAHLPRLASATDGAWTDYGPSVGGEGAYPPHAAFASGDDYSILASPEDEHSTRIGYSDKDGPDALFMNEPRLFSEPRDSFEIGMSSFWRSSRA